MNNTLELSALILLCLLASGACFAGDHFKCPGTVHLSSGAVAAEDIPAGYESLVSDSIIRLSGVSAYDGPPKEGAALKPSASSSKDRIITWKFEGDYPMGKWVSCDYANGLVRLISRAGEATTSCVARTETLKPQGVLLANFICK